MNTLDINNYTFLKKESRRQWIVLGAFYPLCSVLMWFFGETDSERATGMVTFIFAGIPLCLVSRPWKRSALKCNCGKVVEKLTTNCHHCNRTILNEQDFYDHINKIEEYITQVIKTKDINRLIEEANVVGIIDPYHVVLRGWHELSSENLKNIVMLTAHENLLAGQADKIHQDAINRINNTVYCGVTVPL